MELDQELSERTRAKGLKVINESFFDHLKSVAAGTYDGAHVSHIVEHFTPVQVEELFKLLHHAVKPGSPMVILTPNIANMRRAVGDFWRDPTHVRPYPISALGKLLRRAGWEVADSGEYTDRKPSPGRALIYAIRNALLGRYWCGDDVFVVVLLPNTPALFAPQAHSVPSVLVARQQYVPKDTCDQLVNAPTCLGLE